MKNDSSEDGSAGRGLEKAIFLLGSADARVAGQRRFRILDLWIRFGKIISKACPIWNLFLFGVCEGFNSGAKKLDTN